MTAHECPRDARPIVGSAYVCEACSGWLERSLGDVTALADAVPTAYAKGIRSDRHGPREDDPDETMPLTAKVQPLPYDQGVSNALRDLHAVLVSWVRLASEEQPVREGPTCHACLHLSCSGIRKMRTPANTASALARWLLGHVSFLTHHEAALEAVEEIAQAVGRLRASLDVAPEEVYAGPCTALLGDMTSHDDECGEDLYARLGASVVACRACSSEYDVAERRVWLLAAAEDHLATLPEIERAIPRLAEATIGTSTLRQWKRRQRLIPHGIRANGQELYRIGDVLDLMKVSREMESEGA